jgi:MFS family permease
LDEDRLAGDSTKIQRIRGSVRALRHRNYRIYFFAMLVSFTGTWMQTVAQSWLIYRLSGSAWLLGLVGFVSQVPVFVFAPVGGVLADRHSRRRIVILTQTLAMAQALVLAALTLTHHVTVEAVIILALMLGLVNAVDLPTRQSFIAELVDRRDMMNAIALNSTMINGARVVGPALAGLIVAGFGEGICFLVNGVSYVSVIAGLAAINMAKAPVADRRGSAFSDFMEGFRYVRRTRPVRAILLLVAFVSIFGLSYIVLMPVVVDRTLHEGPRALGVLLGAAGVGALCGAIALAVRERVDGLGRVVAGGVGVFGAALLLFSISRSLILSMIVLVPIGFTLMLQMSGSNTLVQSMVPDRMRGRVMSFYSMSLMGMVPFGNLFAGAMADRVGAPYTVGLGAVLCIGAAILFGSRLRWLRDDAIQLLVDQAVPAGDDVKAETVKG